MTTPIRRRRPSNRCASWSKATKSCSRSSSSAPPRTPPCRNISTPRRSRSCSTSTGASRFSDPQERAWTIAYNPNYQSEARIYAKYILTNHPNARIGILYQNDDLGRDYIAGLKSGLGDKAASMIVGEVSYETTDPTVDSQVVKLKSLGADLLFDASTPKWAAQAIKKVAELGWNPVHILDINASPVSATLKPAGLDISKGIISTNYGKDPSDPQWKDDPGVKAYFAFMDKYFPEGDKLNTVNTYGYSTAELLVHVLPRSYWSCSAYVPALRRRDQPRILSGRRPLRSLNPALAADSIRSGLLALQQRSASIRPSDGVRAQVGQDHRHNHTHEETQRYEERYFPVWSRERRLRSRCRLSSANAQKKYDTGATDTEIKIGQTIRSADRPPPMPPSARPRPPI